MSVFRSSLEFFDHVGLFDVVLPFLLVFTIVFGVLEKSKIFGTEKVGDKSYTRKNLNSMVAFCTAFFVVASAQLVALINVFVARVALILIIIVMFMILIGSFHAEQGDKGLDLSKWIIPFTVVILIAITLIFLDGVGWLGPMYEFTVSNWNGQLVGTMTLLGVIVGFIIWVTSSPKEKKNKAGS